MIVLLNPELVEGETRTLGKVRDDLRSLILFPVPLDQAVDHFFPSLIQPPQWTLLAFCQDVMSHEGQCDRRIKIADDRIR